MIVLLGRPFGPWRGGIFVSPVLESRSLSGYGDGVFGVRSPLPTPCWMKAPFGVLAGRGDRFLNVALTGPVEGGAFGAG